MQSAPPSPRTVSLAGEWRLALDRTDAGADAGWFARPLPAGPTASLPGSLAVQRIGDDVTAGTPWTGTLFDRSFFNGSDTARYREPGKVRLPFWLQPEKVFVGAAWYQREIEIPAAWRGQRVVLSLERAHWFTRVWLEEREIGRGDSLSGPHEFDLGCNVAPGPHRLTLQIDNRLHVAVGENAHSVSDHTQGNWNGAIGRVELRATAPVWIDDLQIIPHVATRSITVRGAVKACSGHALPSGIALVVDALGVTGRARLAASGTFDAELALGPTAELWDEFSPKLYELTAGIPPFAPTQSVIFGLREIAAHGRQLLLNHRPLFLRGTIDACVFPLTGHPPMDVGAWRKILRTIQAHGLNHVRFHSWCPPEAAFVAGDELGVYFQVEAATWPNAIAVLASNSPAGIGDGASVDAWTLVESERIVRTYGNHPCFIVMAAGNEPGGPHHRDYLTRWVSHLRALDPRRLYSGASGWPELPENQFHVLPEPRAHHWGAGLKSRLNALPPATTADYRETVARYPAPVIAHEIGQWCAYPPLHDSRKYSGHLRAHNYGIFADSLAAHHLADRLPDFVRASGKLQALCYKEEIESALRTPELGGFQLLGLQDFPGQGTAPVGVLDAFGESKGAITAEAFRQFCGATVPLVRLARRVFTTDESLEASIECAHFGPRALPLAVASWRLVNEAGRILLSGQLPPRPLPLGKTDFSRIAMHLRGLAAPARYRLVVLLDGTPFENGWDVWVYPAAGAAAPADGVMLTDSPDAAESALAAGLRVLLTLPPARIRGDVALGFTPIFWNTWCTQRQPPHTLGILCDPTHPALAGFPTDEHTNWQWWHLVTRAGAMVLDEMPPALRPVVSVIDDWCSNRRLGLVYEARIGAGRLLVSSIDLANNLGTNPVARQLRASLLRYAASPGFSPAVEVSFADVRRLLSS